MENKAISIGILTVNIISALVLFYILCYIIYKCFTISPNDKDHKFFTFKLSTTAVLCILNFLALYVNYEFFFVQGCEVSGVLLWLRYSDRVCMAIYAWFKVLEIYKYRPSAYNKQIM